MLLQIVGNNGQLKRTILVRKTSSKTTKNSAFPVKVKPKAGVTYANRYKGFGFWKSDFIAKGGMLKKSDLKIDLVF